jgi:hypothetical protein
MRHDTDLETRVEPVFLHVAAKDDHPHAHEHAVPAAHVDTGPALREDLDDPSDHRTRKDPSVPWRGKIGQAVRGEVPIFMARKGRAAGAFQVHFIAKVEQALSVDQMPAGAPAERDQDQRRGKPQPVVLLDDRSGRRRSFARQQLEAPRDVDAKDRPAVRAPLPSARGVQPRASPAARGQKERGEEDGA